MERIRNDGKFFRLGNQTWRVKGLTYGPFAPNGDGDHLPDRARLIGDFAHIERLGANAIRLYHAPPAWVLDAALAHGLRVLIDVPWEKHRCFFEDWSSQQQARQRVRDVARTLGGHPATFAVSVANELPNDVVRFYGHRRVERFLDELIDAVRQEAPDCLTCFGNFPTTEFLQAPSADFCCFNVYLHHADRLAAYLERLQHLAGNRPLLLGEYGIDTLREGEAEQAERLAAHVRQVFRCGLAGSFVFSYTDEWFTGGAAVEDWAFGITRRDRSEKPAARRLRHVWAGLDNAARSAELPPVSVVICSYNGASTLPECLASLMWLNYPDYEVILVDDGSTDRTPEIAEQFPQVVYLRQPNRGLSAARNVGAETAQGEIVAYTDSDCVVHRDWLLHLIQAMQDQRVDAIGGPNVTPSSDSWIAKCVAASPGNPGHVLLDDRRAEHVPGCNMAWRRDRLLALGGFDPQFRVAGDDVDMCWRFLDAGLEIGYAPGALVWHHRRSTVRAYLKQQRGYGRAEAMLHFKHPRRFGGAGCSHWRGVIYGDGAAGLSLLTPRIYYGPFGSALFQMIYRSNGYSPWAWCLSLEWHALALFLLALSILYWPLALGSAVLWSGTAAAVVRAAWLAALPRGAPLWCRPLVGLFHLLQPIVRGGIRCLYRLGHKRLPPLQVVSGSPQANGRPQEAPVKRISAREQDLYWESHEGHGREHLLGSLIEESRRLGWNGRFDACWSPWDVELLGDRWSNVRIRTVTEELGGPRRFTRVRWSLVPTVFSRLLIGACCTWTATAAAAGAGWGVLAGAVAAVLLAARLLLSRRQCARAVARLITRAAVRAELRPVDWRARPIPEGVSDLVRELSLPETPAPDGQGFLARTAVNTTGPQPSQVSAASYFSNRLSHKS